MNANGACIMLAIFAGAFVLALLPRAVWRWVIHRRARRAHAALYADLGDVRCYYCDRPATDDLWVGSSAACRTCFYAIAQTTETD